MTEILLRGPLVCFASLAALLSGAGAADGAGAAGGPDPQRVRELIESLDDDAIQVRNAAEARLIDFGPTILDTLPEASSALPAETRHRLARVRDRLDRERAAAWVGPTHVNRVGGRMAPAVRLAAIQEQTGNRLRADADGPSGRASPHPDLEFDRIAFWPALDQLMDGAGWTTDPFSRHQELRIVRAAGRSKRFGSAAYSGPFRMEAVRVEAHRDLVGPERRRLAVHVRVEWEPRLTPIAIRQPMAEVVATDADGTRIEVADPRTQVSPVIQPGTTAAELRIPFVAPPRSVDRIARLAGRLHVLLLGPQGAFRFTDLTGAGGTRRHAGEATVTLESLQRKDRRLEVRIRVAYEPSHGALESHRGWFLSNPCYLLSADGGRIEYETIETARQGEGRIGLVYVFLAPESLDTTTLVYRAPVSIHPLVLDYALPPIELP